MSKINLKINGLDFTADQGQTILDVAKTNDLFIPTLCHDERVKPFGACLLCRVEVEGARGSMLACATPVVEGMVVITESEAIQKARKMCLELLVSQHYGDCVAPCSMTCPAKIDVQGYIAHIANGQYQEAIKLIKERNPLPLVCGRVCTRPCEDDCRRNLVDERVGIDYLKRFATDYDLNTGTPYMPEKLPSSGKKAAIIGAGPAGLSCAYYLAILGHDVTIFEKWPTAGGMLRYGIPEYRLPREPLQKEIDLIVALGVEIKYNTEFGKDITYSTLKAQGYETIFLGVGSQVGSPLGLEQEDAEGIMTGVGFLGRVNLGEKLDFTNKKVIVIGGGNTALDASRTSIRLNALEVVLAYRRTKAEMPAHEIEIEEAEYEGVKLELLAAPKRLVVENNKVKGLEFIKMRLGEPDASGRRRPEEITGSEYIIAADVVIAAIGQTQDLSFIDENFTVSTNRNRIIAHEELMTTNIEGVFAGGDAVTGPDAAISAIAAGRRAAMSMNLSLLGKTLEKPSELYNHVRGTLKDMDPEEFKDYEKLEKIKMPLLTQEQRHNNFNEVELGFDEAMAKAEAQRCLSCGCKDVNECKLRDYTTRFEVQQDRFIGKPSYLPIDESHKFISKDQNKCITCGLCVRICSEQQGAGVLGFHQRGYSTTITASFDMPFGEDLRCENCGQCISVCPVGALTEKTLLAKPGPFIEQKTETTCFGCSTGCTLIQNTAGNNLVRTTSQTGLGLNSGNLCERGRFGLEQVTAKGSMKDAVLRENSVAQTISIPSAIEKAAEVIQHAVAAYGASKVGMYLSPELTNEQLLEIAKLAGVIGTDQLSTNNPSEISLLLDQLTGSPLSGAKYSDFMHSDYILIVGFDIKETNPVAALILKNAIFDSENSKLVVLSETETASGRFASNEYIAASNNLLALLTESDSSIRKELAASKKPLLILSDSVDPSLANAAVSLLQSYSLGNESILLLHDYCNMRGLIEAGANVVIQDQPKVALIFNGHSKGSSMRSCTDSYKIIFAATEDDQANLFIPTGGACETEGTYTNSEGVQNTVRAAFPCEQGRNLVTNIDHLIQRIK